MSRCSASRPSTVLSSLLPCALPGLGSPCHQETTTPPRLSCCMCRHMAGLTCLVQIPFPGCPLLPSPESAESSPPPYAPATGLGWTVSSDELNRILHRSHVQVSPVLETSRRDRLVQPLASPLLFPWETPIADFGLREPPLCWDTNARGTQPGACVPLSVPQASS